MATNELTCRVCSGGLLDATAIWFDATNKKTKQPICKYCYEQSVTKGLSGELTHRDAAQNKPGYQQRIYNGSYTE